MYAITSRLGDEVGFDHNGRVWCVSDLHIDTKSGPNYRWLKELPERPNDALICAGDICTSLSQLRHVLTVLKSKFSQVFYTPGNHELWTYMGGPNSVEKCLAVLDVCDEVGVLTTTTFLGDSIMIAPLFSWWTASDVATGGIGGDEGEAEEGSGVRLGARATTATTSAATVAGSVMRAESGGLIEPLESKPPLVLDTFDCLCMWPAEVGDPANPHNSGFHTIQDFFLQLNSTALAMDTGGRQVISFSHFVPSTKLCPGVDSKLLPILCCTPIMEQISRLKRSAVHCFGHSHQQIDIMIGGTRFVQCALGHAKDRSREGKVAEGPPDLALVQVWPLSTSDP